MFRLAFFLFLSIFAPLLPVLKIDEKAIRTLVRSRILHRNNNINNKSSDVQFLLIIYAVATNKKTIFFFLLSVAIVVCLYDRLFHVRYNIIFLRADAGVMFCSCLQFSIASYATCFSFLPKSVVAGLTFAAAHTPKKKKINKNTQPAYKITTTRTAQTIQQSTIHCNLQKRKTRIGDL